MENQIHFKSEQEVIEWLLGIVNSEEEYESLISDLSRITGLTKNKIEKEVKEKMKTIQEIKSNFEQILEEVIKINGLPVESATQVATAILQETGKFERTEMMNNNRNGNGNQPATFNQKRALRNLKINFNNDISKSEASRLIEQAVQQLNAKKQ